jgi:hypothetical protein
MTMPSVTPRLYEPSTLFDTHALVSKDEKMGAVMRKVTLHGVRNSGIDTTTKSSTSDPSQQAIDERLTQQPKRFRHMIGRDSSKQ